MIRLLINVEGQTEETFVNEVLSGHLYKKGYGKVSARIFGNARQRNRRGGVGSWQSISEEFIRQLSQDEQIYVTTMVDFYGMPAIGNQSWPGREEAKRIPSSIDKARHVEKSMHGDIVQRMGAEFNSKRFVPFTLIHEFESLLFSDCDVFLDSINNREFVSQFKSIRNGFATPEDINDSPETAPSKRILSIMKDYEKPIMGNIGILGIGLDKIRSECPHFNEWVTKLESLATK
ncbi:DUF4276 family protein [Leptospira kanakyensis]|uniref:DUF4276 family protein n=1 Tax=Leptospira kanakyensis TaxID=2484968 RepID=A0A6N4QPS7_9LEPT|nr:DUF4276 family protein [Leptospira kanakyensis]TGK55577.1 DUF4276 family protein [Leptospira kanakyensis]TGK61113.1 DUF4276 family protein [Leptospira kanakyensis]TGK76415.1 DUF4276 family protein [Leptospira kanakyensis]